MVRDVVAVLVSVGVLAVVPVLLGLVFRAQIRRYNRIVAAEVLDEWTARLGRLTPEERHDALLAPPAYVVAAMASLPSYAGTVRNSGKWHGRWAG